MSRRCPSEARPEGEPRDDELNKMIPQGADLLEPMRSKMQPPAQWIGNRLSLVMIIQAREVAPADIASKLDERSAEHDSKSEPTKQPDDNERWRRSRKWTAID